MHDSQRRGGSGGSSVIQRAVDRTAVGKRTLTESYPTGAETSPSPPAGALPAPVRAKMESYFQADFSAVRVREDDRARQLGAIAYAQGDELVFRPGAYDPASRRGQELIGHELAHVVQQRQGRAAMPETTGGGAAAPVQRYRDVDLGGRRVHLSDRRSMFVHVNPDEPNKAFYAKPEALQRAQAALATAGSFIHLQAAEIAHGFARIEPRFVGPQSERGQIYGQTHDAHGGRLATSGSRMGMASDCNNAARMVMGVIHDPAVTEGAPFRDVIERPVMGSGEDVHEVMPGANVTQAGSSLERATLTALTASLIEYRALVQERPIAVSHAPSVQAFLLATANLAHPGPPAWRVLGLIRTQHPELYADFSRWAGIDAEAAPEVGDALVAWRFSKDPTAVNERANGALAETMRAIVQDDVKRGVMSTALGLRITALQQQLAEIPDTVPNAQKRQRVTTDLGRLQAVQVQLAGFNGANGAAIATAALAAIGLAPNTTWNVVSDSVNTGYGSDVDGEPIPISEAFGMGVEAELGATVSNNAMWNKHWGGVVMTEPGGDYVTLENDASTESHGLVNTQWRFTMYGTRDPEQSFHRKNEATGDFGSRASTMRFRAPNREPRELPELTPAERLEQLRQEEVARQAELDRQQALDDDLRRKGIPKGLTIRPYSCGVEAMRMDRPPDMDPDGGPPALYKTDGTAQVNTDPVLEAEAEAHGIAAAAHVPPAAAKPERAPSPGSEEAAAPVNPREAEAVRDAREASLAG